MQARPEMQSEFKYNDILAYIKISTVMIRHFICHNVVMFTLFLTKNNVFTR